MNPHDEIRYWRNLAMQRGHERLDPDYINNAIRDIYENDLRHSDHNIHPTGRSRTPHPPHAFTPHTPRAHTLHGPRGNEPQSHASSGIEFHPLPQPPYHHPPPPHQQHPHNMHTPAYLRAAVFNPYPSHGPHYSFPPFLNEGIRINPGPMLSNHRSQWRPPFAGDASETWRVPQRSPGITLGPYAFRFPVRPLPYPHAYPYVPEGIFRAGNTVFGQDSASAPQMPAPPPASAPMQQPPDPYTAAYLSGGWTLPGPSPWWPPWTPAVTPGLGSVPQWSPGTWPPMPWPTDLPVRLATWLIPNPVNPGVPQIEWDVSTHPTTARHVTGAHVILPLGSGGSGNMGAGIDQEPATSPASDKIFVLCDFGLINQLWGPIVIERPGRRVTIRDLLEGIYAFFQMRLTRAEVELISFHGRDNYRLLLDAYQRRTMQRPLGVLRDWEGREGMRRVDCLEDGRWWWGAWVTYNSSGTWQLNLGLVNSPHRNT